MGVRAVVTKGKGDFKGKSVIKTQSFIHAANNSAATHVRFKDGGFNAYELITEKIEIYKRKNGNVELVDILDFKQEEGATYFIEMKESDANAKGLKGVKVTDEKSKDSKLVEVEIEPQLYSQVVVMGKNDKGKFYRCDDGRYIHQDEIQIPAYKKVDIFDDVKLEGPIHDGKFYIEQKVARIENPETKKTIDIVITSKNKHLLTQTEDGTWMYDGKVCKIEKSRETRQEIGQVLLDGDKIVETSKIRQNADGNFVVNVGGNDIVIDGKKNVALKNPFVQVNTTRTISFSREDARFVEGDLLWRIKNGAKEKLNGLQDVRYSKKGNSVNIVYCHYGDGRTVWYVKHDHKFGASQLEEIRKNQNIKIYRVKDIKSLNNEESVRFDFDHPIEIKKSEIDRKIDIDKFIADGEIKNITWGIYNGNDAIVSYERNGIIIKDITWDGNKMKKCTLEYDEDGEHKVVEVEDIYNSEYADLAIETEQIKAIEDIEVNEDGLISFTLGNYKIWDAELLEDGNIGECKIQIGEKGEVREVNLSEDSRFAQLRLILTEHRIEPLVRSKLLEKKDGKYQVVADVVQTGPLLTESEIANLTDDDKAKILGLTKEEYENLSEEEKENSLKEKIEEGLCGAHSIESIEDAIKRQEEFKKNPYKTVVIDENGRQHELSDFKNKYEGISEFELDPRIMPKVIGNTKIQVSHGFLEIDSKDTSNSLYSMTAFGFGVCTYMFPLGMLVGTPVLALAAAGAIIAPIARAINVFNIRRQNPDKIIKKMQRDAEKICKEDINKYDKELKEQLEAIRQLPEASRREKEAEIRQDYEFKCKKAIAKLQFMTSGSLNIPFDLSKKSKLTDENLLGYLIAKKQVKELKRGNKAQLDTSKRAFRKAHNMGWREKVDENAYKAWVESRTSDEHIAKYGSLNQRLELYKKSEEYLREPSAKKREELVKKRREALLADARVAKPIQLGEVRDNQGQSVCEKDSNIATNHVQEVLDNVHNEGHNIQPLAFDSKATLPPDSVEFKDTIAHQVNVQDERIRERDTQLGTQAIKKVDSKLLEPVQERVKQAKNIVEKLEADNDFEKSYKAVAKTSEIRRTVADRAYRTERLIDNAPYLELNPDEKTKVLGHARDAELSVKRAYDAAHDACDDQRKKYKEQVEVWTMADYVSAHQKKFNAYASKFTTLPIETVMKMFIGQEQSLMLPDEREKFDIEMQARRIKNNVEELVKADVFCGREAGAFQKWLTEYNVSNGKNLSMDDDEAKSIYFAERQKGDLNIRGQYDSKTGSSSIIQECEKKAQERIENGTLLTSELKQKKADAQSEVLAELDKKRIESQALGLIDSGKPVYTGGKKSIEESAKALKDMGWVFSA